jgi:hypothetical protein
MHRTIHGEKAKPIIGLEGEILGYMKHVSEERAVILEAYARAAIQEFGLENCELVEKTTYKNNEIEHTWTFVNKNNKVKPNKDNYPSV